MHADDFSDSSDIDDDSGVWASSDANLALVNAVRMDLLGDDHRLDTQLRYTIDHNDESEQREVTYRTKEEAMYGPADASSRCQYNTLCCGQFIVSSYLWAKIVRGALGSRWNLIKAGIQEVSKGLDIIFSGMASAANKTATCFQEYLPVAANKTLDAVCKYPSEVITPVLERMGENCSGLFHQSCSYANEITHVQDLNLYPSSNTIDYLGAAALVFSAGFLIRRACQVYEDYRDRRDSEISSGTSKGWERWQKPLGRIEVTPCQCAYGLGGMTVFLLPATVIAYLIAPSGIIDGILYAANYYLKDAGAHFIKTVGDKSCAAYIIARFDKHNPFSVDFFSAMDNACEDYEDDPSIFLPADACGQLIKHFCTGPASIDSAVTSSSLFWLSILLSAPAVIYSYNKCQHQKGTYKTARTVTLEAPAPSV